MALRPTDQEILAIIDVSSLADWCGISATTPVNTNNTTPPPISDVQALFAHLGCGPTEHFRPFATFSPADWGLSMDTITVNGSPPNMSVRGKYNLFHGTARRLSNLEPWPEMTPTPTAAPPATGVSQPIPSRINTPILNVGRVLDQRMGDEITYLESKDILIMNARYVKAMEVMPPVAKAVTIEQLTALEYTVRNGRPPNADFAIFKKHGGRTARAMAFTGLITVPGGTMKSVEILGPPDLATWKESYDCLFTALIMLDVVRRPALAAYRAHIISLHEQYGPKCWALLYQADARCRAEHMDRLRYLLLARHNAALMSGQLTDFDVQHPWDSVWAKAATDTEYWEQEFRRHALMIVTSSMRIVEALGTDAQVSNCGATSSAQPFAAPNATRPTKPAAKGQPKTGICRNFNAGSCPGNTCSKGHGQHICSICTSPNHGASKCPKINKGTPAQDTREEKRGWGKDKKRRKN
jgi:hypothetical protein